MKLLLKRVVLQFLFCAGSVVSVYAQDMSDVEVVPHQLAEGLYYLQGSGGNIGVSIGSDGVILIDDQFAELSDKIVAAIESLSSEPVRFLLNTHYHPDHTGGNANFGKAGAVIIAHDNVRTTLYNGFTNGELDQALNTDQQAALPVMTFSNSLDLFLNREMIHAFHVESAHTDGDSFVVFKNANVIHTGDVFRTTSYPRVDTNASGSFHGIVAAYEKLLEISNEQTRFLPGHGVVSSRQDVQDQLDMFNIIRDRVKRRTDVGDSLRDIQASKPSAEFDAQWSGGNPSAGDDLVEVIYNELGYMY